MRVRVVAALIVGVVYLTACGRSCPTGFNNTDPSCPGYTSSTNSYDNGNGNGNGYGNGGYSGQSYGGGGYSGGQNPTGSYDNSGNQQQQPYYGN